MASPKYKIQTDSLEVVDGYTRMKVQFNGHLNKKGEDHYELWEMRCVDGEAVKAELAKVAKMDVDKSSPVAAEPEMGVVSPRDALEVGKVVTLTKAKLTELGL